MVPAISFALSLIINYIIVSFLSYFHIYTRFALIILLIAEFIFLASVFVFHKLNIDKFNGRKTYNEIIHEINLLFKLQKSAYDVIKFSLFILSILLLIYLSILLIFNIGKIFNAWDAVFSWNRWALDFYNNKIPTGTYHYPQLIPANWSISYVLCGYPLQFIPRGLMPLFLIFPVYSLIILGIKQKSTVFFSSVFFLFLGFNRLNWTDGCVDVPVAFFSILAYISLILIKKEDHEPDKKKYILLSTIFVCGAAVTKQAGIFVVVIYPLLLYFLTKDKFEWTYQNIIKFSSFFLTMVIIIVLPFYSYVEIAIRSGSETSEIHYVTNEIYHGASYPERLLNACRLFSDVFSSRLIFVICIYPFLLSFTDKTFRLWNFVFVIPYSIIWAIFFSYDLRNVAIVIPFFCLGIGVGLDIILKRLQTLPLINASIEK
ncbi:MAG: hypothetical protein LLG13_15945 [Bacteroidales bacterium]|nr:hypothetical protein [Bacteroidales bacterium]